MKIIGFRSFQLVRFELIAARADLFMEGQVCRGIYILRKGLVRLITSKSNGKCLVLRIIEPGEGLGFNSVIAGGPHKTSAETLEPSELAFIERENFLRVLADRPDACLAFAQCIARDFDAAYFLARSVVLSESIEEPVAAFLLKWSDNSHGLGEAAVTHQEIANLIGSSRETVTRILNIFRRRQLIELNRSGLIIRNRAALEQLAD